MTVLQPQLRARRAVTSMALEVISRMARLVQAQGPESAAGPQKARA